MKPLVAVVVASLSLGAQAPGGAWAPATERIFEAIGLSEGQTVCEVGAGNGELSFAAARVVGPKGRVLASELGAGPIGALRVHVKASGFEQVAVVEGDPKKTNFPDNSCDALLLRFVWHHLENRVDMSKSIAKSLKPGGRVAIVEGMMTPPVDEVERGIKSASIATDLEGAGLERVPSDAWGPRWFMVVLRKQV